MKRNQRTIKLTDTAHRIASKVSDRFGLSMAALVEVLIRQVENTDELALPPRDPRSKKSNSRKVLKGRAA